MISGFGHVNLGVSDIDKMVEFYTDVIGLTKAFELKNDEGNVFGVYMLLPDGNYIEFIKRAKVQEPPVSAFTAGHLCFEVEDINKAKEIIDGKGIEIIWGGMKLGKDKNWQIFINDPENNKIELMQMDPESPQRLGQAKMGFVK